MNPNPLSRRRFGLNVLATVPAALGAGPLAAQTGAPGGVAGAGTSPNDIRIAHIHSRSGALEGYGKQTATGFMMGLDYATGGSYSVAGRKLAVIECDDQGSADRARDLLLRGFRDERIDIAVGTTSTRATLALLPLAEEFRRVLLVEPAVADAITGEQGNRYVFRTSRSASQEAIANAVALDAGGGRIAVLAQDSAYGRDGAAAFRQALRRARSVHDEFLPTTQTDFSLAAQRLVESLKGQPGRKRIWVLWAGGPGNPFDAPDLQPAVLQRHGIELATAGSILAAMVRLKAYTGLEGATYYHYAIPKNPANEWLVANHYKRFRTPPDFFTVGGMSAAMALVEALKKTQGRADGDTLVTAMEGLRFDTPKGPMQFRAEDHQAMQSMYHYRVVADAAVPWAVPTLVREIKPDEIVLPVQPRRR